MMRYEMHDVTVECGLLLLVKMQRIRILNIVIRSVFVEISVNPCVKLAIE